MEAQDKYRDWHVFATDLDQEAIEAARRGLYPDNIRQDITPERLKKFFSHKDDRYQVSKELRDKMVFAVQDLITDPPFSRMDLISARNILIYFDTELQKKIIPLFHYALNDGGLLFLGTAETVGEYTNLFRAMDKKWRIYRNVKTRYPANVELPTTIRREAGEAVEPKPPECPADQPYPVVQTLLKAMPPSVLIDSQYRILYVHGQTGHYLELKQGVPQKDASILEMAREDIRTPLAMAINRAMAEKKPVLREAERVKVNSHTVRVNITVRPIDTEGVTRLAVTFEDVPEPGRRGVPEKPAGSWRDGEGAAGYPRESAHHYRGTGDHQRGAALGQRGVPVGERRTPEHQRGDGDLQGRAAVGERGAADREFAARKEDRRAGQPLGRHAQPFNRQRHRNHLHRRGAAHHPLHAGGDQTFQSDRIG